MCSLPVFGGVRVAHLFSFLCCVFGGVRVAHLFSICCCCPIMCIYALSSGLWCPLQFPHKSIFDSSFPPVVCGRAHYLCLFSYNGVHHILCCVFVLFVFAFCTLFYQCLWIVHFRLPLWYSLTFMKQNVDCYWGPTNRFNSITFLLLSHAKIWNSNAICCGLFCFQWFGVRGERCDCLSCWYW